MKSSARVLHFKGVNGGDTGSDVWLGYRQAPVTWITCIHHPNPIVNQTCHTSKKVSARLGGVLLAISMMAALSGNATGQPAPSQTLSLKQAARGLFEIGVGVSDHIAERPADWALLMTQFSYVTPENCMKPAAVQGTEGRFDFTLPDAFISFAGSNGLKVCGHCLVWAKDDRTPPWFYLDGEKPASRELLLRRMKTQIDTLASRYRGRIGRWDVVNEALDDGTNFLRPSGWVKIIGEDFIAKAFEYAHAADPKALLIYNDYNNELTGKREKLIRLVNLLRERHAPVDAIGLQGHYEIDRIPFQDIEATLVAMRNLKMKVEVSELDIDVIPRGQWWADGGKHREELAKVNPYPDGCPPDILQRQAEQYAQLFQLFRRYADVVGRISFWDLHDGQSWLNSFPWQRVNYPLLFDRQGLPKPAFGAVVKALSGASPK
jgi:endo-1,4-beta-xylanase